MSRSRAAARAPLPRRFRLASARRFWAGLLALLVAMSGPVGTARTLSADDERARAHFVAGDAYFEDQRYAEAAREFHEAYQLSGRPEMLVNLSRAHERAGAFAEAEADLELLLARHPQTSYRADAEARLATLRAAHPELVAPPAASPAPAPAAPAPAPPHEIWPPRLPALVLGGAAVASALAAVATGWAAHAKHEDLEARCEDGCPADVETDAARGERMARTSTGLTFAAIALGGASAVLWVLDVRASDRDRQVARPRATRARVGVRSAAAGVEARVRVDF